MTSVVEYYLVRTLGLKMFAQGGLFMKENACVSEGGNGEGRVATPTSISIFDFYKELVL